MPLRIVHGVSRKAATPHPPPGIVVMPFLRLVTVAGVRGPVRWRLQGAIIISIVHSIGLALVLELGKGLRLWRRRRRSASSLGFFIVMSRGVSHCFAHASTGTSTASSSPPSARTHGFHPRLGQRDPGHVLTPASRTASRTTALLRWKVRKVGPCYFMPPRGGGKGLHLVHLGKPTRCAPHTLLYGAAGTVSPTLRQRCSGRSRLHACWPTSATTSFC